MELATPGTFNLTHVLALIVSLSVLTLVCCLTDPEVASVKQKNHVESAAKDRRAERGIHVVVVRDRKLDNGSVGTPCKPTNNQTECQERQKSGNELSLISHCEFPFAFGFDPPLPA